MSKARGRTKLDRNLRANPASTRPIVKLRTAIAANFKVTTLIVSEAPAAALAVADVSPAAVALAGEGSAAEEGSEAEASVAAEVSAAEVAGANRSQFTDSPSQKEFSRSKRQNF